MNKVIKGIVVSTTKKDVFWLGIAVRFRDTWIQDERLFLLFCFVILFSAFLRHMTSTLKAPFGVVITSLRRVIRHGRHSDDVALGTLQEYKSLTYISFHCPHVTSWFFIHLTYYSLMHFFNNTISFNGKLLKVTESVLDRVPIVDQFDMSRLTPTFFICFSFYLKSAAIN